MADSFRINGVKELRGEITVRGSKNEATKIVASTLLTTKPCTLVGLPRVRDVEVMLELLEEMGASVQRRGQKTTIRNENINPKLLDRERIKKVRASIVLLGPLVARFGEATLPYPGGDPIGARPIDTHLHAFEDLGCSVRKTKKSFTVKKPRRVSKHTHVVLDEFSVTATENVLMYAAGTSGTTTLSVAAEEPHIQALGNFLTACGARITPKLYHTIEVHGRRALHGALHHIRPDYIEAGTLVCAVLAVGGDVRIRNFPTEDLELFLYRLKRAGARVDVESKRVVRVRTSPRLRLEKIQTMIYPGVPTDLQSPLGVLATQSRGTTLLHDPLYEGRLNYLKELRKMGASVRMLDVHRAEIKGPSSLHGVTIEGKDIRGAMSLIIAGLAAQGTTVLKNAYQVDRGYENIDERLRKIGATIERV